MVALAAGVLASISCLLLLLPAWRDSVGAWITVAFAIIGIGAGIVALEGRGRRPRWASAGLAAAMAAGVVGAASAVPQPDLSVHVSGYQDCPLLEGTAPDGIAPDAFMAAFYAPDLVGTDTESGPPLPFGTSITVAPTAALEPKPIATFTVDAAVDVTEDADAPPANGVYLAVPVTMEATDGGLACFDWRAPPSYWYTDSGGATSFTTVEIPGYPTIEGGGVDNGDGTFTYCDIFDVTPDAAANGGYELDLLEPDGTTKPVFWAGAS